MRGVPQNSLCASRAAQTTAASQMTKQACPSAGLPPRIPPNAGVGRRGEAGGSQQPTANSQQPALSIRSASNGRSEEHTSELQSHLNLVCRLLLEKKKHNHSLHTLNHTIQLTY